MRELHSALGQFFRRKQFGQPASLSAGTPKLLELSLIKASVEFVKVCGESVRSGPLEESNRSNVAVTASVPPGIEQNAWLVSAVTYVNKVFRPSPRADFSFPGAIYRRKPVDNALSEFKARLNRRKVVFTSHIRQSLLCWFLAGNGNIIKFEYPSSRQSQEELAVNMPEALTDTWNSRRNKFTSFLWDQKSATIKIF